MQIRSDKIFDRKFARLSPTEKDSTRRTLELFEIDPYDISLANHPLRRPLSGMRAISVSPDIRIAFREKGGYAEVFLLNIGTHEDIYK